MALISIVRLAPRGGSFQPSLKVEGGSERALRPKAFTDHWVTVTPHELSAPLPPHQEMPFHTASA
jgi:hypothetical protein